jgi:hypothetical protein
MEMSSRSRATASGLRWPRSGAPDTPTPANLLGSRAP